MLVLKKPGSDISYNLMLKTEHRVGRFGCLRLENDQSVSREHALIKMIFETGKWQVQVTDSGSKYGTFINEGIHSLEKIPANEPFTLELGDRIRFGRMESVFILENEPLQVYVSLTTAAHKSFMTSAIKKLKGKTVTEWSHYCSHYTANSLEITNTVALALILGKPIITVDYWKRFLAVLAKKGNELPDYAEFLPIIKDFSTQSDRLNLKINLSRKNLFKKRHFISFTSTQYLELLPVIEAAGGTIEDLSTGKIPEEILMNEDVIVLQPENSRVTKRSIKNYSDILKKQKKRFVKEIEVYMSVIDCSLETYCNPNQDISDLVSSFVTEKSLNMTACSEDGNLSTGSGPGSNFSLTVNELVQIDGSDDDSVDVIEDSLNENINRSLKRKLSESTGNSSKNLRIDSFFTRKESTSDSQTLRQPSNNSKRSDNSDFPNRSTRRTSDSLFSSANDRKESTSRLFESSNVRDKSSNLFNKDRIGSKLFEKSMALTAGNADQSNLQGSDNNFDTITAANSSNNSDNPIVRSSSGLFAGLRKNRETPALFAGLRSNEPSTSKQANKRKANDETSPVLSTLNKTRDLFNFSTVNKKIKITQNMPDSDSIDGSASENDRTLLIPPKPRGKKETLTIVNIPTTISLNKFRDVLSRKTCVKTEPQEIPAEIQNLLNKTVVLTVSLVRSEGKVSQRECFNSESLVNFKKFRKNQTQNANSVIPITSLSLYQPRDEFDILGDG